MELCQSFRKTRRMNLKTEIRTATTRISRTKTQINHTRAQISRRIIITRIPTMAHITINLIMAHIIIIPITTAHITIIPTILRIRIRIRNLQVLLQRNRLNRLIKNLRQALLISNHMNPLVLHLWFTLILPMNKQENSKNKREVL